MDRIFYIKIEDELNVLPENRYFPDPDILPIQITNEEIENIRKSLPTRYILITWLLDRS